MKPRQKKKANTKASQSENKQCNRKSRWLKIVGGAILLVAFASQQFFVAKFTEELEDDFRNILYWSQAEKSSLLHLNIYFSSGLATQAFDGNHLKRAARESANGLSIIIVGSKLSKEEKTNLCNRVFLKAQAVVGLDTYNDFIQTADSISNRFQKLTEGDFKELLNNRRFSTYLFIGFHLIGSILLLYGIGIENQ